MQTLLIAAQILPLDKTGVSSFAFGSYGRSDVAAVKDLIRKVLPRLHAEANDIYVPLEIKLTQWLVVGFINYFPPITALRILEASIESTLTAFDVNWLLLVENRSG